MLFRNRAIIILVTLLLLFLVGQIFFFPTLQLRGRVGHALQAPGVWVRSFVLRATLVRNIAALSHENQGLHAQIVQLKNQPEIIEGGNDAYLHAQLFSQYPFNNTSEVSVAAGEEHGLVGGENILAEPGIFFGKIIDLKKKSSSIQTIFSRGLELPVKIGDERVDGLLVGSNQPRITLISKSKAIQSGDRILLASPDFPFGLTIGFVDSIEDKHSELFQEASISLPYKINDLNEVYILLDE
ncbi:MAG: hypothetical protein COU09_01385 [Candidatus Harrisonbacteria bacterium CG10_big_fil_rev_8_21_14_0_10_44_23]|uniref:Cell shape-determining protein MreC n=1 Tax=Candidatus Harrisonbacteria bacterium CG10_big_fil_rev_8_21_14_0_10_44_23 TaxID=1974585 RepID=A0A2H0UQF9_9BACT|nr:MAG: hypothetical protein COU09_01385 [Candidatus Harrisonbacteria bacterium CG10_big_fil_rev_8_21_14_0_10_44_23]